ncbi:TPR domain protein [Halenospora varia]|nr:TPR domain protein [Halenospora varia]
MTSSDKQPYPISPKDEYYNLGSYHRPITTTSPEAQTWFDRGLIWTYAFNHEEAATCFENAIAHDPTCAMAYWGLAYTLGPNYNKPWGVFDSEDLARSVTRTHRAATQAQENAGNASRAEKALIDALQFRYPDEEPAEDFSIWNRKYMEAMKSAYRDFSNDLDISTLYVDALMNLTPWALWDITTGQPAPEAHTLEAKSVLDRTLSFPGGLHHPGLLHLYIHLMEMSPSPESALTTADHLRGLVPDSGHLNHMPTHLDILCGDYRRAIASNSEAILADQKFVARAGALNFYTLYRCHDMHFRIYAAMFSGQSAIALESCSELEAAIPEELLRVKSPPMADWLEGFVSVRVHVLIRFGKWEELISLPLPQDQQLYCVTSAMTHYGKGVAFAATGLISQAESERELFLQAVKRVPDSRTLFNNTCKDILNIAEAMLEGELSYRQANYDLAFSHLRKSIELDDALPYDEPWGWMQPTRHAYGALLLEQGKVEKAEAVYRADLGFDDSLPRAKRHPNNVWALHGYHECLERLGRSGEAKIVGSLLRMAVAVADVPVRSSCFCRLETETACCE